MKNLPIAAAFVLCAAAGTMTALTVTGAIPLPPDEGRGAGETAGTALECRTDEAGRHLRFGTCEVRETGAAAVPRR